MEDLVSIIIPVYNKEKYISKCMESVLAQTYETLEIVVINDGSTDRSSQLIMDFIKKDKRIKFFSQVNAGVGVARNKGILNATGKYILFLDADDILSKNYVENLMKYKKYDLVVSGIRLVSREKKIEKKQINPENSVKYLPEDIEKILTHDKYPIFSIVCTKLFNLSTIKENDLTFLPIQYGEDSIFMISYLAKIKTVKTISFVGYINNVVLGTLSHGKKKDVWKQAKLIPEKARDILNLSSESNVWQFLMLRSMKLSFMNSTNTYREFKKNFKLIEEDGATNLLTFSKTNRLIDNFIILMVKYRLTFILYRLFKLRS
ncbi:glycosyltransferase family 2 protein [Limosilactobacillus reuteri]|uniref:glycosyltransferase family 2 protein n=1 Tax=Limosilactobacillus reuteri TaxID=1598 RepID=UPI003D01077C